MLSEQQCRLIERALTTDVEARKLAAYLSLHMGLTISEIVPLKVSDVDYISGTLQVSTSLSQQADKSVDIAPADKARILQMPEHVISLFRKHRKLYVSEKCYLLSGTE